MWEDFKDLVATSKVFVKGIDHPFIVTVNYSEYVQKKHTGEVTKFWSDKPQTMLKKVAESQVLRKAFDITGLYDESELHIERNKTKTILKNKESIKPELSFAKKEDEVIDVPEDDEVPTMETETTEEDLKDMKESLDEQQ